MDVSISVRGFLCTRTVSLSLQIRSLKEHDEEFTGDLQYRILGGLKLLDVERKYYGVFGNKGDNSTIGDSPYGQLEKAIISQG